MPTLRELEAGFKKHRPDEMKLEAFYAQRRSEVAALGQKVIITSDDLIPLDRLGRYQVAAQFWGICSQEAKHSLLHDEHHSVRSAAILAD